VAAWHREGGRVVLDEVGVDDGVRRTAVGHAAGLELLVGAVTGTIPVMVTGLDILDALYDAGRPLPARLEDPALGCLVLDPDRRLPPPGLGGAWRHVLGRRKDRGPAVRSLERLLDELPDVHAEVKARLDREGMTPVYEDPCLTAPVLAGIEREGFHVDAAHLADDIAYVVKQMDAARAEAVAGPRGQDLRNTDLVREDTEQIAKLVWASDGDLPREWRTDPPTLERYALYGNPRAQAIHRLRALDAVHGWMKRIEGKQRLPSVLEPSATGRCYPHDEALATIPKHLLEAALLRRHIVPEPGHLFVGGDFSAFEPRILAHQSGDAVLVDGSQPGHDIYTELMPRLVVTDRGVAKSALLGLIFGRSREPSAPQNSADLGSTQAAWPNVHRPPALGLHVAETAAIAATSDTRTTPERRGMDEIVVHASRRVELARATLRMRCCRGAAIRAERARCSSVQEGVRHEDDVASRVAPLLVAHGVQILNRSVLPEPHAG